MKMNGGLFTSASQHWATPKELYDELDKEFHFNDDPCPLHGEGGLDRMWGSRVFLNPPYGREITEWLQQAWLASLFGSTVVCLIPSRTDTKWWHNYVMKAAEIRFLRGRLKFGESKNSAPFPSAIVIFKLKIKMSCNGTEHCPDSCVKRIDGHCPDYPVKWR